MCEASTLVCRTDTYKSRTTFTVILVLRGSADTAQKDGTSSSYSQVIFHNILKLKHLK